jgi:inosine-uridine nucleoside N-ribohydrolase
LAYALKRYPKTASKIARVWWMGGAVRVGGNTFTETASSNGNSEVRLM